MRAASSPLLWPPSRQGRSHLAASINGFTVTVQLRFVNGKAFVPADLLNALKVQYGAAKITSPVTSLPQVSQPGGPYTFDVLP